MEEIIRQIDVINQRISELPEGDRESLCKYLEERVKDEMEKERITMKFGKNGILVKDEGSGDVYFK